MVLLMIDIDILVDIEPVLQEKIIYTLNEVKLLQNVIY